MAVCEQVSGVIQPVTACSPYWGLSARRSLVDFLVKANPDLAEVRGCVVHLPSVSHIPQVPSVQLVPEVVTVASMPETAPQETLKDGLGSGQLQVTLSYSQASDSPLTAADVAVGPNVGHKDWPPKCLKSLPTSISLGSQGCVSAAAVAPIASASGTSGPGGVGLTGG